MIFMSSSRLICRYSQPLCQRLLPLVIITFSPIYFVISGKMVIFVPN